MISGKQLLTAVLRCFCIAALVWFALLGLALAVLLIPMLIANH